MNSIKPKILNFWNILRLFDLRTCSRVDFLSITTFRMILNDVMHVNQMNFQISGIKFLLNFGYKYLFGSLVVFLGLTAVEMWSLPRWQLKIFTLATLLYNAFETKWNKFLSWRLRNREFELGSNWIQNFGQALVIEIGRCSKRPLI